MNLLEVFGLVLGVFIFFKYKSLGFFFILISLGSVISNIIGPYENSFSFGLKLLALFIVIITCFILGIKHDTKGKGIRIKGFMD